MLFVFVLFCFVFLNNERNYLMETHSVVGLKDFNQPIGVITFLDSVKQSCSLSNQS